MRAEMERERLRRVEEERLRVIREKEEAEQRQAREITDNRDRKVQLVESYAFFEMVNDEIRRLKADQKKDQEVG
jgi:cancer susceptibility candidate protein 1